MSTTQSETESILKHFTTGLQLTARHIVFTVTDTGETGPIGCNTVTMFTLPNIHQGLRVFPASVNKG